MEEIEYGEEIRYNPEMLISHLPDNIRRSDIPITPDESNKLFGAYIRSLFTISRDSFEKGTDCLYIGESIGFLQSLFENYVKRIDCFPLFQKYVLLADWVIEAYNEVLVAYKEYDRYLSGLFKSEDNCVSEPDRVMVELRAADMGIEASDIRYWLYYGVINPYLIFHENKKKYFENDKASTDEVPFNVWGEDYKIKKQHYKDIPVYSLNEEGRALRFFDDNCHFFSKNLSKQCSEFVHYYQDFQGGGGDCDGESVKMFFKYLDRMHIDYANRIQDIEPSVNSALCLLWFNTFLVIITDGWTKAARVSIEEALFYYQQCLPLVMQQFSLFIKEMKKMMSQGDKDYFDRIEQVEYDFGEEIINKLPAIFEIIKRYTHVHWESFQSNDFSNALLSANLAAFNTRGAKVTLQATIYRLYPYVINDKDQWLNVISASIGKTAKFIKNNAIHPEPRFAKHLTEIIPEKTSN